MLMKKDFELIARVFAETQPRQRDRHCQWSFMACKVADALATTNPKFDRARFLAACGVQQS